jgi:hypothetical protein
MDIRERFPGIAKATLEISYDNGVINRDRSENDCLCELRTYLVKDWLHARHAGLKTIQISTIIAIDHWLSGLSNEDLNTVCNGEETEACTILAAAPPQTADLLNGIFERVC